MIKMQRSIQFVLSYVLILIGTPIVIRTFFSHYIDSQLNFIIVFLLNVITFVISVLLFRKDLVNALIDIKNNIGNSLQEAEICLGISILMLVAQVIMAVQVSKIIPANNNEQIINEFRSVNFALSFLLSIFIGPFLEEILFRFILFKEIKMKNRIMAYIMTGCIFGFMHCYNAVLKGNIEQLLLIVVYFIPCTGFNYIYERTDNIVFPTVFHSLSNVIPALAVILK